MKTNNSLNGGSLRTEHYRTYADYLVKAIRAYGQEGIALTDLTAQNEPEFATGYPSMSMTSAQQADFLRILDQALTAANLPTNILAYDHNWDHPNYPLDVFARTGGIRRIIGAAFHCYGGAPAAQKQIADAGKRVFFTECSGTDSANPATTFGDTLRWHAENLVVQNMRNGGETVINWNLALDRNGGPTRGTARTAATASSRSTAAGSPVTPSSMSWATSRSSSRRGRSESDPPARARAGSRTSPSRTATAVGRPWSSTPLRDRSGSP